VRILLIGGTRFIGPYVVREIVAAGHQVAVYHRGQNEFKTSGSNVKIGMAAWNYAK